MHGKNMRMISKVGNTNLQKYGKKLPLFFKMKI